MILSWIDISVEVIRKLFMTQLHMNYNFIFKMKWQRCMRIYIYIIYPISNS